MAKATSGLFRNPLGRFSLSLFSTKKRALAAGGGALSPDREAT